MRWVAIPERCGYLVARFESRDVLLLLLVPETGNVELKILGWYSGEWKLVGERRNVLAFKVERLPRLLGESSLDRLRSSLPSDLRQLRILQ